MAKLALARRASYPAKQHILSVLLTDAASGQPVALDYAGDTTTSSDPHGNAQQVTLKIPAGTSMPDSVRAWVIADVYPLSSKQF